MNLFKNLFKRQKDDVLIGGKTMEQLQRDHEIRIRRERMARFPEKIMHGGQVILGFE